MRISMRPLCQAKPQSDCDSYLHRTCSILHLYSPYSFSSNTLNSTHLIPIHSPQQLTGRHMQHKSHTGTGGRSPRVLGVVLKVQQIGRHHHKCTPAPQATAVDHLVMTVDGFNASKAVKQYPPLKDLQQETVQPALDVVQGILPQRILGSMLTQHPQLLSVDMVAWADFLSAFGFEPPQVQELLRTSPAAFYNSNVFQAGQLLLFLRQDLQLPDEDVLKHFKWAAVLRPNTTQESMRAVTQALQQHLAAASSSGSSSSPDNSSSSPDSSNLSTSSSSSPSSQQSATPAQALLPILQTFPEVLGWDVATELQPRLAFFEALGPAGTRLLRGTLWEPDTSWLPGLRSWGYSVAPKLKLLEEVLGSNEEAQALVQQCPTVLKLPVESKLQPVLASLTSLGLNGDQVAQLLRQCPQLLAQNKDDIVSRVNFLIDAIGAAAEDLLSYPGYVLLSLADVIGPRYYFLARHPGWLDAFSDPATGALQLRRVLQPPLEAFLEDVAQVTGVAQASVEADYATYTTEWNNLLGWCADKAFSSLDSVSSMYQEQLNLFYVLVQ